MEWKFTDDRPIWQQLSQQIAGQILIGVYPPGSKLPPVRELAAQLGVNPNTMQRAMAELEREGLVHSQRTAGRFVTEDRARIQQAKRQCAEEQIQTFLEKMEQLGYTRAEILQLMEQQGKGDG